MNLNCTPRSTKNKVQLSNLILVSLDANDKFVINCVTLQNYRSHG